MLLMKNAKSHFDTLRYLLIMYTVLFTYVAHNKKKLVLDCSDPVYRPASSAGATWLSVFSILILCVAPARFLNRTKNPGVGSNKHNKNIL